MIEVLDSRTYEEALLIDNRSFADGLMLRAAPLAIPVVRAPAAPPGAKVLEVTATADAAELVLDGLVFAGGEVAIAGDVPRVVARFCSLEPRSVALTVAPASAGATLVLRQAITGPITAAATVALVEGADCIVQHPGASALHPEGFAALTAAGRVELERVTVVGGVHADALLASNCILFGDVVLADSAQSCLRFTRYRADLGDASAYRCTGAFPIFVSLRYGDAGYAHLHPNTAPVILAGAEEGGEMGGFQRAATPWRLRNLRIRLEEYLPAGLRPVPVRVLPRLPFAGAIRP